MDELSPLFQEIEFSERWRGYDPDEVDAFVDRVARAAALAQGQLTALRERAEQAEARGPASGSGATEETLTRTLVLAQKTADAAVAEAREEADRLRADAERTVSQAEAEAGVVLRDARAEAEHLVAEAERRAAELLADADAERRQMVADAEAVAAEAATAERDRLAGEIAELNRHRAFLADDVTILERHLGDERHRLRASLTALAELLEDPAQFRARPAPATSGVEIDEAQLTPAAAASIDDPDLLEAVAAAEPAPQEPVVAETLPEETSTEEPVPEERVPEEIEEAVAVVAESDEPEPAGADATHEDETAGATPQPAPVLDEVIERVHADEPDEALIDLVEAEARSSAAPPTAERGEPSGSVDDGFLAGFGEQTPEWDDRGTTEVIAPPRLVTRADLGDAPVEETIDAGPATAPVAAIDDAELAADVFDEDVAGAPRSDGDASLFAAAAEVDDDPFLAQLRDAVAGEEALAGEEDALSAFFDHDEDDGGRSWFGRRR